MNWARLGTARTAESHKPVVGRKLREREPAQPAYHPFYLDSTQTHLSLVQSRTHFSLRFLFITKPFNLAPTFSFARPLVSFSKVSSTTLRPRRGGNHRSSNYLYKQSFGYGRYAYDEYGSGLETDRDSQSSKQLVSSWLRNLVFLGLGCMHFG